MSFESAYAEAVKDDRLQLPRSRALGLYGAARGVAHLDGEFWECGVYKGGSAKLLTDVLDASPRPLRLFDTFRGFLNVGPFDRDGVQDGRMFYSENAIQDVLWYLKSSFVSIHTGPIPQSFVGLEDRRIAFANVDVDLYRPTCDALGFILPRIVSGGVIIVDDYGDPDWPGVARAVDEMVNPENLSVVETQARIYL